MYLCKCCFNLGRVHVVIVPVPCTISTPTHSKSVELYVYYRGGDYKVDKRRKAYEEVVGEVIKILD